MLMRAAFFTVRLDLRRPWSRSLAMRESILTSLFAFVVPGVSFERRLRGKGKRQPLATCHGSANILEKRRAEPRKGRGCATRPLRGSARLDRSLGIVSLWLRILKR